MTRPEIIRADSIDLQDQNAPSAQDHTRQPTHPAPLGAGPPAPHQAETLRELAVEAAEEKHRSPRVSKEWSNGEIQGMQQYGDELAAGVTSKLTGSSLQQQDELAVAQNGGLTGSSAEDAEMADAEGDDGMDDDMMDKISSSPSIDDGGYSLPILSGRRFTSIRCSTPPKNFPLSQGPADSSAPFVDTPDHFPLRLIHRQRPEHHDLHQGEYEPCESELSQDLRIDHGLDFSAHNPRYGQNLSVEQQGVEVLSRFREEENFDYDEAFLKAHVDLAGFEIHPSSEDDWWKPPVSSESESSPEMQFSPQMQLEETDTSASETDTDDSPCEYFDTQEDESFFVEQTIPGLNDVLGNGDHVAMVDGHCYVINVIDDTLGSALESESEDDTLTINPWVNVIDPPAIEHVETDDGESYPLQDLTRDRKVYSTVQWTEMAVEDDNWKPKNCLSMISHEVSYDEEIETPIDVAINFLFMNSGWDGECLQFTEDIDFEFVYALHTFVATVEGQANATKGDTMVLLDDSNSYWWLVRVVKDSSIGYLPAEHIETPTERLARLNKHRNIDLTSTMLGDQAAKSSNPLKKAIRRRNAKTVTFTAPTYVEASDIDYSSDEEEGEGDFYGQNGQGDQNGDQQEQAEEEEVAAVETLKPRAEIREVKSESLEPETNRGDPSKGSLDASRTSDEIFDGKVESKSRNGTVRNTDSFFKDDSVETRKITLTPNLLRDDSSTSTRTSNDSKELKQRPSLDKLEKDSPEKSKDKKGKDKKEKEKKPGMLSGLFKRKEKKTKISSIDEEIDELTASKRSNENSRSSPVPSKDSDDIVSVEEQPQAQTEMQRQPSKLQKQPRTDMSPNRKQSQSRETKPAEAQQPIQQTPAPERAIPAELAQAPSMRLVQPEPEETAQQGRNVSPELSRAQPRSVSPEITRAPVVATSPKEPKSVGAISKMLRSASSSNSEPKPVKAKKAKARVELDDFDSSSENSPIEEPVRAQSKQNQRPIPGSFPDSYITSPSTERSNPADERLSESPVQVSPVTPLRSYPPPLMVDTSSQEEPASPVSSPSPELIDADDAQEKKGAGSSTTSTSTPTWSDAHLRTFFDDDAEIKDLLVVVYDKSGVVPAGPEHPVTGNLFKEENAKLADITNRLDGMLGDWLARKMRTQSSR